MSIIANRLDPDDLLINVNDTVISTLSIGTITKSNKGDGQITLVCLSNSKIKLRLGNKKHQQLLKEYNEKLKRLAPFIHKG